MGLRGGLTIGYLVILAVFWAMTMALSTAWWSVTIAVVFTAVDIALMIRMRRRLA